MESRRCLENLDNVRCTFIGDHRDVLREELVRIFRYKIENLHETMSLKLGVCSLNFSWQRLLHNITLIP